MRCKKLLFILCGLLCVAALSMTTACKSSPKPEEKPVDPELMPPSQDALDRLDAAMARAENGRNAALDLQGDGYFPEEWARAESDNAAGKGAGRATVRGVNQAIALFGSAADVYESIAENSAPLYAQDVETARAALNEAIAAAGKSRQDALDNQGSVYFPDDWQAVEDLFQSGEGLSRETLADLQAAAALYQTVAESYNDIAERSRPLYAKDKDDANKALQAASARADQSRKDAQSAQANTYFANDWKAAEAELQAAKNAKKGTLEEINAAAAMLAAAADKFDELTAKSLPMAEKDNAQKALTAAIARAEKSRQAAMDADGPTYFANDWKAAETKNTAAKNAKKGTPEEIKAATAQFTSAADAYDDIAKKSAPRLAQDKDAANKALQAAIARAEQSRKLATDAKGQANFPNEWKDAEAKNQTARNAKRATVAEMKAATPLYNSAADAYDGIVRKNNDLVAKLAKEKAETDRQAAATAKTAAEKERQTAIAAKAPVAVRDDYNKADTIYQQGVKDFNAQTFASAADRFNQSTPMFASAAQSAGKKHDAAEDAITRAKQRSADSAALAENTARELEGSNESR